MNHRCKICLEETCKGRYDCHCETCSKMKECYRFLHPTIRITTKCTQSCSHCCFSCSPAADRMMNIDTAEKISVFLKNNDIFSLNLMGGEFFLNPGWFEILSLFFDGMTDVRLVTTGDWITDADVCHKLQLLKEKSSVNFLISISKDKWHHNRNIAAAETFLLENGFRYNIGTPKESTDDIVVPIGRSEGECSLYGMCGCYCHNPKNMYSFLINEEGTIYKCPFGVWNYASIEEYQSGGFCNKFKEFNKNFYGIFMTSCASCIRAAGNKNRLDTNKKTF